jgi:hypothetical protein
MYGRPRTNYQLSIKHLIEAPQVTDKISTAAMALALPRHNHVRHVRTLDFVAAWLIPEASYSDPALSSAILTEFLHPS